jgi:tetratricopeptide (TPR) repeat protein
MYQLVQHTFSALREVSQVTDNNRNWLDSIKKLPGWITGFIAFVTAVVGFIQLWQGDTGLVTMVLLAIGVGGGWLGCAYLAFKRTPPLVEGGKGTWQYPRWRPWALASLVIIPLLTGSGVGYHFYQQAQPPTKVIFLMADFDGPEPQKYRVTETVLARLRAALEPYDDVEVKALGRAIPEAEGSAAARTEGEKRKATIVIWGWYGVTAEAVPLSVHFEVLRPPEYMPELGLEAKGLVQAMAVAELESFDLQTQLSAEMAYLSLFTVGMARYAAEDWDAAIARFSDALNQTAERVPALDQSTVYFYRGLAYDYKGDYDRAIADHDQAIQLKPDLALAYSNRGLAYIHKGDYDRAIADYDQAIQLKPDLALAYNNRGGAYSQKGDLDRAIADYDQAIQLKPDFAEAYMGRGTTYVFKGDYDRAIADCDQAIQLKPDFAEAYMSRGAAYADKGDYDHAVANFDQAIRLQPDDAKAYYNRGRAYHIKGDTDHAIADYNQAIQLQPAYALAYNNRGGAYRDKGDYNRAIADWDQAIQLKPNLAEAYNNRGLAYADKGDLDRAIADYDQAIRIRPHDAAAHYNRGLAYIEKGEKEKAIADFNKFLELSNDPDLRQQAEEQLKALGAR